MSDREGNDTAANDPMIERVRVAVRRLVEARDGLYVGQFQEMSDARAELNAALAAIKDVLDAAWKVIDEAWEWPRPPSKDTLEALGRALSPDMTDA